MGARVYIISPPQEFSVPNDLVLALTSTLSYQFYEDLPTRVYESYGLASFQLGPRALCAELNILRLTFTLIRMTSNGMLMQTFFHTWL